MLNISRHIYPYPQQKVTHGLSEISSNTVVHSGLLVIYSDIYMTYNMTDLKRLIERWIPPIQIAIEKDVYICRIILKGQTMIRSN